MLSQHLPPGTERRNHRIANCCRRKVSTALGQLPFCDDQDNQFSVCWWPTQKVLCRQTKRLSKRYNLEALISKRPCCRQSHQRESISCHHYRGRSSCKPAAMVAHGPTQAYSASGCSHQLVPGLPLPSSWLGGVPRTAAGQIYLCDRSGKCPQIVGTLTQHNTAACAAPYRAQPAPGWTEGGACLRPDAICHLLIRYFAGA